MFVERKVIQCSEVHAPPHKPTLTNTQVMREKIFIVHLFLFMTLISLSNIMMPLFRMYFFSSSSSCNLIKILYIKYNNFIQTRSINEHDLVSVWIIVRTWKGLVISYCGGVIVLQRKQTQPDSFTGMRDSKTAISSSFQRKCCLFHAYFYVKLSL